MASPSPAKNKDSVSVSSLLSSSPPIPSRPNPKPRNSETGDPMRRSFRGSPFPADLSRRNSTGRAEFGGDKENQNEKDHPFSNAVKAPKSSKNFMSPTISAVSKINPSPRKKVLSDRNEVSRSFDKSSHQPQVKSCVSFSNVISVIGEDQICIEEKKQLVEESHDMTVTDYDEIHENKSNGDFDDSSFKISPLPTSVPYTFPVFGSQEVDPLVAPYDPKKNYLSPRPQFLHYKPNPRIEHHFDECKQLEELFISESSSDDTDVSAEESQQEEEVVVAVEEEAEEIEGKDGEERLEAADEEEEVVGETIEEEEEETGQISKQSRFKISKFFGLVLALGVAYLLLVSSETLPQPNILKDSPFYYQFNIPPEITKAARESFEQLSEKLGMWAGSSLVYLDKLISSLGEEEGYGAFQYHNLTHVLEDKRLSDTVFKPTSGDEISVDGLLVDSQEWSVEVDVEEENGDHQEPEVQKSGGEINPEAVYKDDGSEFEQESEGGDVISEIDTEMNGVAGSEEESGGQATDGVDEGQREYDQKNVSEFKQESEGGDVNSEMNGVEGSSESLSEEESGEYDQKNVEEDEPNAHQLGAISGGHQQEETEVANAETVPEEQGAGEIAGNSFSVSEEASDVAGNDVEEEGGLGEVVDDAGSEEILLSSSNQKKAIVLFSTVMVVLVAAVAAAFLSTKKKAKNPVVMLHEDVEEPTTTAATFEHVPVENLIKEKLSSLHFQEEKEEVVDDGRKREVSSFPSEMSFSFHKNKRDGEGQSGGGGKRSNDSGESMASSASEYSMGSVSYGSFTTYEKIQKKSGRKEADMVTPVRRSSRIRSHQHSGQ